MTIYWVLPACSGFFLLCTVVTLLTSDKRSGRLDAGSNPWFRRFGLLFLLTLCNWLLLTTAGPFILVSVAVVLSYAHTRRQSRLIRAVFPSGGESGAGTPDGDAESS